MANNTFEEHYDEGVRAYQEEAYDNAAAAFRAALVIRPTHVNTYFNLGESLRHNKHFAGAEEAYRAAISIDPKDTVLHEKLGDILMLQEKDAEAEAVFKMLTDKNPEYNWYWHNLGLLQFRQDKLPEAERALREASKLQPSVDTSTALAIVLKQQGKSAEASTLFAAVVSEDENAATAVYYHLGLDATADIITQDQFIDAYDLLGNIQPPPGPHE